MSKEAISPEYIFETSWEVCNKVGGIYTVLSTKAQVLQQTNKDKLIFVGPDFWKKEESPYFKESKTILKTWRNQALKDGLSVRVGRWTIPGEPIAILVDFTPFFGELDHFYYHFWEKYQVNSLHAYGDYNDAAAFGIAAGKVIESFFRYVIKNTKTPVVAHFHEWMTGFGALYVKENLPSVATAFTTHATSIGRSIAANGKLLYAYMEGYNGDQMAGELNMEAKHSIEKVTAHKVDCFTTVSDITATECKQLLDKKVDIITPNGFEDDFVPKNEKFDKKRNAARKKLKEVAEALTSQKLNKDTLFVATSGRYEFKNKGIDVFVDSLKLLNDNANLKKDVVAFIMVPANVCCAREDLKAKLKNKTKEPLNNPVITHNLYDEWNDRLLGQLKYHNLDNIKNQHVKIIFVPCYLTGNDGIFNMSYYDLLIGFDLTVFPSYYEPWGYTPLESVAFSIPTITTSLSGFGSWVNKKSKSIDGGVAVIKRDDANYMEVANEIQTIIAAYSQKSDKEVDDSRKKAAAIAQKAQWENFIEYYQKAYSIALNKKIKK